MGVILNSAPLFAMVPLGNQRRTGQQVLQQNQETNEVHEIPSKHWYQGNGSDRSVHCAVYVYVCGMCVCVCVCVFVCVCVQVDMHKVNMDIVKPWITKRVTEILGFEDDVVIEFIFNLFDGNQVSVPGLPHLSLTLPLTLFPLSLTLPPLLWSSSLIQRSFR